MSDQKPSGVSSKAKAALLSRALQQKSRGQVEANQAEPSKLMSGNQNWLQRKRASKVRFSDFPAYKELAAHKLASEKMGVANPFFKSHDGVASATSLIAGREYINFASYNYLDYCGDPRVSEATVEAVHCYGTSASASRPVSGERPIQQKLEAQLAKLYQADDAVVFVSGHATNVSTISCLFGPRDLVVHDELIHNSALQGIKLSGAFRQSFPHNNIAALDRILAQQRGKFERVLIIVEGVYSMDGDVPDLPQLIDVKLRHDAFLMVDEAHSLGVIGATGRGLSEHWSVDPRAVDIWMGTLSKSLASCGGYIVGEQALIDHLKFAAAGFVYSVGLAPPLAAAASKALELMLQEPERVAQLQKNGAYFIDALKCAGVNTGLSMGFAVTPALFGGSLRATKASNALFEQGINAQPIIYPAVEEKAARIRFFLTCAHTREQMDATVDALSGVL